MDQIAEILARLKGLSAKDRNDLKKQIVDATLARKWIANPGPQTDAVFCAADILLYGGSGGAGKGFKSAEPVLTPFGWRKIGDIKIGDRLCATDGTTTRVIGVYRRGVQPMYRLSFADRTSIECDGDHIWLAWNTQRSRKIGNARTNGCQAAQKWTTRQIHEHYGAGKERLAIPLISKPVCFNVAGNLVGPGEYRKRNFSPYALGVLLGDGYLGERGVKFSSADSYIIDRVEKELGVELSRYQTRSVAFDVRIPNHAAIPFLTEVGLIGTHSDTKFIPRTYLLASEDERWSLLQGLLDTDGTADKRGGIYFCSTSERLSNDVAHLARSLGAICTVSSKLPTFTYNGQKRTGKRSFNIRIKFENGERAFGLPRKKERVAAVVPQFMGKSIVSIEKIEDAETICIAVSHPNNLYIVHDFIVTHNTDLLAGLALTEHKRSALFRRQYTDLGALIERVLTLNGTRKGFNGQPPASLKTPDGRLIEFGAAGSMEQVQTWQGQPHDFRGMDEACQMIEAVVRFLLGWVRNAADMLGADTGQRCRAVLATNPPLSAEGEWVIGMFRPWLDLTHQNPARFGELRWFVVDPDGRDMEVDGPDDVKEWPTREGVPSVHRPQSRTFIPGKLSDNPFLVNTGYQATLDSFPEPMRSAIRDGNFMIAREDSEWQVIPSRWIIDAQNRWQSVPPHVPMCSIGVDVARGGSNQTVLSPRFDTWFAELIVKGGKETPTGSDVAALVFKHRKDQAEVVIDMGGGYGGSPYDHLKANGIPVTGFNGADASNARTKDRKLGFYNKRAEIYWRFREALDPDQPGGSPIMLPPDSGLLGDLAAPHYEVTPRGILVEDKKKIIKRLGRSTDKGDAVVMAWSCGPSYLSHGSDWKEQIKRKFFPKVNRGHDAQRRH